MQCGEEFGVDLARGEEIRTQNNIGCRARLTRWSSGFSLRRLTVEVREVSLAHSCNRRIESTRAQAEA
jgi:hypothetical protein